MVKNSMKKEVWVFIIYIIISNPLILATIQITDTQVSSDSGTIFSLTLGPIGP